MDVTLEAVVHRLRTPLRTAYGDVHERGAFLLALTGPDGITGRGEAAPLEAYDGVPLDIVGQALERYAEVLSDDRGSTGPALLDACREVADHVRINSICNGSGEVKPFTMPIAIGKKQR